MREVPMWVRFVLFFSALALLLAGLNVYVYRRARRAFGLGKRGRRLLIAVLVAGAVAMGAGRALGSQLGHWTAEALAVVGSTVELAVMIAAGLLLVVDLPRGMVRLVRWIARRSASTDEPVADSTEPADAQPPSPDPAPTGMTRRELVLRGAYGVPLLIGGGSALYGALVGRHDYTIEEVPVRIPGLSPRLEGYTLAQLSDVHFGTFVDDAELASAAELVRRAHPDMVVLTGDLLDHDPRYAEHLGRLVHRLAPLARDGVMAIPGNHDYYAGIDAVLGTLRRGGARTLVNQGRVVGDRHGGFALLGVDDVWSRRNGVGPGPDLDRALSMVPSDLPRVLLCHNPAYFPEASARVQLQLSGHTHGGQVNVGVRLADLVLPYGYVAGRYERDGGVLYVNRGFGTAGPPARIGAPPEVTRVVLTSG